MAHNKTTIVGKMSAVQWQDSGGHCLWCRAAFLYRITSIGHWAIDRSDVTCGECGATMSVELAHHEQEGTTVRTKPVEPGRAGLVRRRTEAGRPAQDFVNQRALSNGDAIEQLCWPKRWVRGRYQWTGEANVAAQFVGDDDPGPIEIDTNRIYRLPTTR